MSRMYILLDRYYTHVYYMLYFLCGGSDGEKRRNIA